MTRREAGIEPTVKLEAKKAPRSAARRPVLVVLQGESIGLAVGLEGERTVIGRGSQSDIVLKDELASRQHAEVFRAAGKHEQPDYYVQDLLSTNGSYVNGKILRSPRLLHDGDKIKIGNHLIVFSLLEDAEAEALVSAQPGVERKKHPPAEQLLCFAPFHIPEGVDLLFREDEVIALEPRAVRVLRYLAENYERVVSKDELLEAVWPDVFTTDGVLKKAISQARHALCDDPKQARFIETYHRRGYRFIAPVYRRVKHYS
jgi:DNA-binding winged helix-turn-helix (wHTH) protein